MVLTTKRFPSRLLVFHVFPGLKPAPIQKYPGYSLHAILQSLHFDVTELCQPGIESRQGHLMSESAKSARIAETFSLPRQIHDRAIPTGQLLPTSVTIPLSYALGQGNPSFRGSWFESSDLEQLPGQRVKNDDSPNRQLNVTNRPQSANAQPLCSP
jgi:hypothetical protein